VSAVPKLDTVQWEVTRRCDQRCEMCCLGGPQSGIGELTTAECLLLIDQFAALEVREVQVFGGEAYLRPDFPLILRRLTRAGIRIALTSGGRRFPTELLEDEEIRPAISHVLLSLDGLEATHDSLRGTAGSFNAALRTMHGLLRNRIPVGVTTQINRRNLRELPTLADFLGRLGIVFWHAQLTEPFGNARSRLDDLLQPSELLNALDVLVRVKRSARRQRMLVKPGNNIGYNGPRSNALRADLTGHEAYTACRQGLSYLAIQPDGTVKGCASCAAGTDAVRHSIRERPLAAIWNDGKSFVWTRQWSPDQLWGFCAECTYAPVCRGGCVQTSQALFGRPGNNPYCEHRVLQLAARGISESLELAPEPSAACPLALTK